MFWKSGRAGTEEISGRFKYAAIGCWYKTISFGKYIYTLSNGRFSYAHLNLFEHRGLTLPDEVLIFPNTFPPFSDRLRGFADEARLLECCEGSVNLSFTPDQPNRSPFPHCSGAKFGAESVAKKELQFSF